MTSSPIWRITRSSPNFITSRILTGEISLRSWGLTEFGVDLLHEYNYLCGLPVVRAVHDATRKTETVQRHENAPHPSLPPAVHDAHDYDEPETPTDQAEGERMPSEHRDQTAYADAAAENQSGPDDDTDDGRSLDELF